MRKVYIPLRPKRTGQRGGSGGRLRSVRNARAADLPLVRVLEHAAARNLEDYVAAFQRLFPHMNADCIGVAGGVAAFTGVGSPLTTVKGTRPEISAADLERIESFFRDHDASTVTIEAAPWLHKESRRALDERGYQAMDHEDVVVATSGGRRSHHAHRTEPIPASEWPEVLRRSSDLPDRSPMSELTVSSAHLTNAQLYGISAKGRWIACAQSVPYDDVVIFSNDATRPEARRQGAQATLIEARLEALGAGTTVMAEVAPGSASERNYQRFGFRLAYARTHHVRRSE
jgi:ribosomal protein S18 acetylase RimI-like enzyme